MKRFLSAILLERISRASFSFLVLYIISNNYTVDQLADYHLLVYFYAIMVTLSNLGLGDYLGKIYSSDINNRKGALEFFISLKVIVAFSAFLFGIYYFSNIYYSFFFLATFLIGISDIFEVDFRKNNPRKIFKVARLKVINFWIFGIIKILILLNLNFEYFLITYLLESIFLVLVLKISLNIRLNLIQLKPKFIENKNLFIISIIGIIGPIKSKIEFFFFGENKEELAQFGILIQIFTALELAIFLMKNYLQQRIHIEKKDLSKQEVLSMVYTIWIISAPSLFIIYFIIKYLFPVFFFNIDIIILILYFRFLAGFLGMVREIFHVENNKSIFLITSSLVSFMILLIANFVAIKYIDYSTPIAFGIQTSILFIELFIVEIFYDRGYVRDNVYGILSFRKGIQKLFTLLIKK